MACVLLLSLIIGIEIVRKTGHILGSYFAGNSFGAGVSGLEGALIMGIEMSLVPLLAIIVITMSIGLSKREIFGIAWKVFVVGALIGIAVGSTYSSGIQSFYCGFIK